MDPLDIISNLHNVKPVFQPVISAIRHDIRGYEVLGRYWDGEDWRSLGSFFHHEDVPEEFKVEVDQHIVKLALEQMLNEQIPGLLFINRSAKQLMVQDGEELLELLLAYEQKGLALSRIVIEVMEHDFDEDFERLSNLLQYYKTYQIQIAVDHVGEKSSNIDRIRQLAPHILKVDTAIIRNHNVQGFQDIMYSLAMLANRIGAVLLFENIEDDYLLYFAWKHGGRYYQGYHLAEPSFQLTPQANVLIDVSKKINGFIQREKTLVEKRLSLILDWEKRLKSLQEKWQGTKKIDEFIEHVSHRFREECFRMFVCDHDGMQISSNFRKYEHEWVIEPQKKGANWAFRPYFLENVMKMKTWKKGSLSEIYSDIETKELIRTFSYPITDQCFLFIDLDYEFMYDHEFLLV